MSFSSDTKKELCRIYSKLNEIDKAEAYGLLLFCKKFSEREISFKTESKETAQRFAQMITVGTNSVVEIEKSLSARKNEASLYKVSVPNSDDCKRICEYFGHDSSSVSLRINRGNIEYDACMAAFLRGAFLTCGNISSPESEYHLEFNVAHKNLSEDLCKIIPEASEYTGGRRITPKAVSRRGSYVVYIKDSEDISDFLTLMGAGNASMNIMQVKIIKDYENAKNRRVNSQLANTDKMVSAAAKQVQAIKILEDSGKLGTLSEELREAAEIRRKYPLVSLKELCEYFETPISKSGLNHRLKKIIELSGIDDKKNSNETKAVDN